MRIIGIIIALVITSLGLSWVLGSQAEQGLENYVTTISMQPGYQAEVTSFEHGLSHSVATITLKPNLDIILADLSPMERGLIGGVLNGLEEGITYTIDIYQGPFILHNGFYAGLYKASISLDPESAIFQYNVRGDTDINSYLQNEFTMGYTGNGNFTVIVPEISADFGDTKFNMGGITLSTDLAGYGKSYTFDGTIEPISLESVIESLRISAISMEAAGDISTSGNIIVDTKMHIDIPSIVGTGIADIVMSDMQVDFLLETSDDGTFMMEYGLSTGSIVSSTLPAPVNNMALVFAVSDMSIGGFNRFYSQYADAMVAVQQDPFSGQAVIMDAVSSMFEGQPVFEIRELSYSQGQDITLNMEADLSFTENIFADPSLLQGNLFPALNAIQLNLNMDMSPSFLQMAIETYINDQLSGITGDEQLVLQVEQMRQQQIAQIGPMIQQFVQLGYLVDEGDSYNMTANMANGALQLNGNPFPLPF